MVSSEKRQSVGRKESEKTKQIRIPLGLVELVTELIKGYKNKNVEFYQDDLIFHLLDQALQSDDGTKLVSYDLKGSIGQTRKNIDTLTIKIRNLNKEECNASSISEMDAIAQESKKLQGILKNVYGREI